MLVQVARSPTDEGLSREITKWSWLLSWSMLPSVLAFFGMWFYYLALELGKSVSKTVGMTALRATLSKRRGKYPDT
jgi:hypothetical protein